MSEMTNRRESQIENRKENSMLSVCWTRTLRLLQCSSVSLRRSLNLSHSVTLMRMPFLKGIENQYVSPTQKAMPSQMTKMTAIQSPTRSAKQQTSGTLF